MTKQEYISIEGFKNYKISNYGNIKSINYNKTGQECLLKPYKSKKGYLIVDLYSSGKRKVYKVHRLVALFFLDNPNKKPQVNHKNGIKNDNRVENLEWCTGSENMIHAVKYGLVKLPNKGKFGKDNPSSVKVNQYTLEGEFIKIWYSLTDIERELGILIQSVNRNCRGLSKTSGGFIFKYYDNERKFN